ncbi:MAG: hypothetical protein JST85_24950 [Acidobacteria bacterium]|nr:hypothetical protein [Acidobacteriota bacterium]
MKASPITVVTVACFLVFVSLIALVFTWDKSNNLLLGRVQAKVGGHMVVVTDCYRTSVPPPQKLENATDGYRFKPCRDADVVIRGPELSVNGQDYGLINPSDAVTVDHGKVLINDREAIVVGK